MSFSSIAKSCVPASAGPRLAPAPAAPQSPFYIIEQINEFIPVYYAYSEALSRGSAARTSETLQLRARLAEYSGIFREAEQLCASGALQTDDAEQARLAVCIAKLNRILAEPRASSGRRETHTG